MVVLTNNICRQDRTYTRYNSIQWSLPWNGQGAKKPNWGGSLYKAKIIYQKYKTLFIRSIY